MSTDQDPTATASPLRELCQEAESLSRRITGTVRRLSIQAGDHRVEVEWDPPPVGAATAAAAATGPVALPDDRGEGGGTGDDDEGGHAIVAPLVGTFYRSPEPGAAPFVEEGGAIEAGQHVAIVEAMKIMNRIESDVAGTVRRILVEDGEMVEYGQPLLIVDVG